MEFENAIKLATYDERKAEIVSRLKEYDDKELLDIYYSAMCYDGSFDFCDVFYPEDIGEYMNTDDAYNFLCRIVYGKVNSLSDYLRFNAYGNLESVSEYDLYHDCELYIDDLAGWLIDYYNNADIDEEMEELFDAWWDIDHDQYDWDLDSDEE